MIRFFGVPFSFLGILLLSPAFLILYVLVYLESKGGGFYCQLRVGRYGRDSYLCKFRSMRVGTDKRGLIIVGERGPRVTCVDYFIRKYKLDELPRLFNVLKGDINLVGPRPEIRKYVELYTEEQRKVLSVRPGIIDYTPIEYVDENTVSRQADDADEAYMTLIMSDKVGYDMKYINNRSLKEYFEVIFLTFWKILR